ncbi:MAG: hypothetical protein RR231_14530 [Acinetobacter sp.]
MLFKSQIVVLGAKSSKGDFDGKPYDSTKVYYQAELQKGDNFVGQVGAEITWGTSFNFEKIKGQKFPFTADATFQQVSNGRNTVTILEDLVPVAAPKV